MNETLLVFNLAAFGFLVVLMWMWKEKDFYVAERIAVGVLDAVLWLLTGNVMAYVDGVLFVGVSVFYYTMTLICFAICLASAYQLLTLRSHRWDNP